MNTETDESHCPTLLSTTATLLKRIRSGDQQAMKQLVTTLEPMLMRWAQGRLSWRLRSLYDTQDLVQESFTRALARIDRFESKGPGAFLAYLRHVLLNFLTDQYRKLEHQQPPLSAENEELWHQTSRFRLGPDALSLISYEQALKKLTETEQQAVILRLEFGLSFSELAAELGKPSDNAARMFVSRAVAKLSDEFE